MEKEAVVEEEVEGELEVEEGEENFNENVGDFVEK